MSSSVYTQGLAKLEAPKGTVPKSRITDAPQLQQMLRQLIDNDQSQRAFKRASVQGLIEGNPPYSPAKLKELGRKDACNVNWRTAQAYTGRAEGIYYDLFSEAPTYMTIVTDGSETPDENGEWSRIMTEELDAALKADPRWDWVVSNSQHYMVMHGTGPLYFENEHNVIPRFITSGDLKVPDNAESETFYWEEAFLLQNYKVHELFEFIENEKSAAAVGWDVEYTKQVIMNAVPERDQNGINKDWEWYQRQFKANSFASYFDTDVCMLAHCFWKEFDGKITHAIIEQSDRAGAGIQPETKQTANIKFLFKQVGRFDSWADVIHPMYYDKGNGKHYGVSGLGTAMFGAMMYENRLRCNLADKAMSPKLLFKPTGIGNDAFNMVQLGDYGKIPAGWDMQQTGMAGLMDDGLAMLQEVSRTTSANLAQYMAGLQQKTGNPITAREYMGRQQEQNAVNSTQISRYYKQLDNLYLAICKRAFRKGSTDELAKKVQSECKRRGVDPNAFARIVRVEANRVSGQGSAQLRQSALDALMGALPRLPEDGQENLVRDWIAAYSGQRSVNRYYPTKKSQGMGNEQEVEAMLQVAAMKIGTPPVLSPQQDPVVFATTFLGAAGQAVGSVQKGGNPAEVVQFLDIAMPAALAHMQRFAQDKTRQGIFKELEKMYKQIASLADQLKKKLGEQMKQQQQQGRNGNALPPDVQQKLAIEDARGKLKLQQMQLSHRQRLQQRAEQHQMEMAASLNRVRTENASADLRTAGEIKRNRIKALEE